jgi:hypothetical protein
MTYFIQFVRLSLSILALTTGNPVYLIFTKGAPRTCDRSVRTVYYSAARDPAFAFVGGPYCLILEFVISFWIMITFYTLLTSLFCTVSIPLHSPHYEPYTSVSKLGKWKHIWSEYTNTPSLIRMTHI